MSCLQSIAPLARHAAETVVWVVDDDGHGTRGLHGILRVGHIYPDPELVLKLLCTFRIHLAILHIARCASRFSHRFCVFSSVLCCSCNFFLCPVQLLLIGKHEPTLEGKVERAQRALEGTLPEEVWADIEDDNFERCV
jgi:hypothetical protein